MHDLIWLSDTLLLFPFPPNSTLHSFVNIAIDSFWSPLMTLWQMWRCGRSAPIMMETSLFIMSIGTSLRCDHFRCISAFDTLCDGRFKAPTTHAILTSNFSGWWFEDIVNSTNFDVTETDDDIALVIFNVRCLPFSFKAFAKSDVLMLYMNLNQSIHHCCICTMFYFNRYYLKECTDTVWVCRVLILGGVNTCLLLVF